MLKAWFEQDIAKERNPGTPDFWSRWLDARHQNACELNRFALEMGNGWANEFLGSFLSARADCFSLWTLRGNTVRYPSGEESPRDDMEIWDWSKLRSPLANEFIHIIGMPHVREREAEVTKSCIETPVHASVRFHNVFALTFYCPQFFISTNLRCKMPIPEQNSDSTVCVWEFDNLRMKADLRCEIQRNESSRTRCDLENEVNQESCSTNHQRHWESGGRERKGDKNTTRLRRPKHAFFFLACAQLAPIISLHGLLLIRWRPAGMFALWHRTTPLKVFGVLRGQDSCQISQSARSRGWSDRPASVTLIYIEAEWHLYAPWYVHVIHSTRHCPFLTLK